MYLYCVHTAVIGDSRLVSGDLRYRVGEIFSGIRKGIFDCIEWHASVCTVLFRLQLGSLAVFQYKAVFSFFQLFSFQLLLCGQHQASGCFIFCISHYNISSFVSFNSNQPTTSYYIWECFSRCNSISICICFGYTVLARFKVFNVNCIFNICTECNWPYITIITIFYNIAILITYFKIECLSNKICSCTCSLYNFQITLLFDCFIIKRNSSCTCYFIFFCTGIYCIAFIISGYFIIFCCCNIAGWSNISSNYNFYDIRLGIQCVLATRCCCFSSFSYSIIVSSFLIIFNRTKIYFCSIIFNSFCRNWCSSIWYISNLLQPKYKFLVDCWRASIYSFAYTKRFLCWLLNIFWFWKFSIYTVPFSTIVSETINYNPTRRSSTQTSNGCFWSNK